MKNKPNNVECSVFFENGQKLDIAIDLQAGKKPYIFYSVDDDKYVEVNNINKLKEEELKWITLDVLPIFTRLYTILEQRLT